MPEALPEIITTIGGIIVASISAFATIFTVVYQSKKTNKKLDAQKRDAERNNAKQSILQLMMEDKIDYYCDHKLPENRNRIYEEYDDYHNSGGNGIVTKKLQEYEEWYRGVEEDLRSQKLKGHKE